LRQSFLKGAPENKKKETEILLPITSTIPERAHSTFFSRSDKNILYCCRHIDCRDHLIEQGPGRGLGDVKIVLECSLDCEHNLSAIVKM